MVKTILFFIVIQLSINHEVIADSRTNFVIKKFEMCPSEGTVKYYGNVTTENGKQYLNFHILSPISLDENIGGITVIESCLNDMVFLPLFTIREKNFCVAMNKYMGEFWYDIERAAQVIPGLCPIPPGRYHIHHMFLDYNKITLQTFPFGTLRITMQGIDKTMNTTVFCLKMLMENLSS